MHTIIKTEGEKNEIFALWFRVGSYVAHNDDENNPLLESEGYTTTYDELNGTHNDTQRQRVDERRVGNSGGHRVIFQECRGTTLNWETLVRRTCGKTAITMEGRELPRWYDKQVRWSIPPDT